MAYEWSSGPRSPLPCECGNHVFAAITQGYVVIVSPQDAWVLAQKWSANVKRHKMAMSVMRAKGTTLSRVIMGAQKGQLVDHKNGNPLDNTRENLRFCTYAQNAHNRVSPRGKTLPKGVSQNGRKFHANIWLNGKQHYLGIYDTPEQAGLEYAKAALRLHGDFARITRTMLPEDVLAGEIE